MDLFTKLFGEFLVFVYHCSRRAPRDGSSPRSCRQQRLVE